MGKYQELFAYIDYFETLTREEACQWGGGNQEEGVLSFSYPDYAEPLKQFVDEVYGSDLLDSKYMSTLENYGVHNDRDSMKAAIDTASFELTKAILTFYIRQERFMEGLWALAVEEKVFFKILLRLENLIGV